MEQLSAFSSSNLPDFKKIGGGKMKLLPTDGYDVKFDSCVSNSMCAYCQHKVLVMWRQL